MGSEEGNVRKNPNEGSPLAKNKAGIVGGKLKESEGSCQQKDKEGVKSDTEKKSIVGESGEMGSEEDKQNGDTKKGEVKRSEKNKPPLAHRKKSIRRKEEATVKRKGRSMEMEGRVGKRDTGNGKSEGTVRGEKNQGEEVAQLVNHNNGEEGDGRERERSGGKKPKPDPKRGGQEDGKEKRNTRDNQRIHLNRNTRQGASIGEGSATNERDKCRVKDDGGEA